MFEAFGEMQETAKAKKYKATLAGTLDHYERFHRGSIPTAALWFSNVLLYFKVLPNHGGRLSAILTSLQEVGLIRPDKLSRTPSAEW